MNIYFITITVLVLPIRVKQIISRNYKYANFPIRKIFAKNKNIYDNKHMDWKSSLLLLILLKIQKYRM